ncbi:hypothetical protein MLD52_00210 [Puniceicoccaceae bacterium K14]|nr:hypothetical protein [Puniceicoccaceae bacterium K14]
MDEVQAVEDYPVLIQGGMGIAISNWKLARAVSLRGHLGVVSGTAIDRVLAYRLQEGDIGGHLRRAMSAFPSKELADRVFSQWYQAEGLAAPGKYKPVPMFRESPRKSLLELAVIASFVEVYLAKEGHSGRVGINLLEKIQLPTLPILYGAMLAGCDYVLMGAGVPRDTPGHLDKLSRHEASILRLSVEGGEDVALEFVPKSIGDFCHKLVRPKFLAIVSSHVLAMSLARVEGVDGFIVESPAAGGHNARPRGWNPSSGEPLEYGSRDDANLGRLKKLGRPFWLAGGQTGADAILKAKEAGAIGIQVGTAFAYCSDSGMNWSIRRRALASVRAKIANVDTEGNGSPTGFPFKTLNLPATEGGRNAGDRKRQECAHGYLRSAYRKDDGSLGWRCSAEPIERFIAKGGVVEDCTGRRCLCNGLLATAGHSHVMKGGELELPLVTSGNVDCLEQFVGKKGDYDANTVVDHFIFL